MRPAVCYFRIGENDANSSAGSAAELTGSLDRQVAALRAKGIWTVIQTIFHRGTSQWPEGDPRHGLVIEVNAWIKEQGAREGMKVCDATGLGLNWRGFDADLFATDTVHLSPASAKLVAEEALLPILRSMVAAGAVSNHDPAAGNLWPNPQMASTAGVKSGTVLPTGDVADGYVARNETGSSAILCSKEAIDGTCSRQVVAITPANDASSTRVHAMRMRRSSVQLLSGIAVAPGDWLEGYSHVELSALDYWLGLSWQFEIYSGGTPTTAFQFGLVNSNGATRRLFDEGKAGFSGWLKVCRFQVPTTSHRLRLDNRPIALTWDKTGTGIGIATFSRPILRKAGDHTPAWTA